jgi:pyroglutamyl-peptidase
MHCVAETGLNTIVGFIHVPYLPEQVVAKSATPSMSEHLIAGALRVAIESVAEHISS